jgi:hypothetical protein
MILRRVFYEIEPPFFRARETVMVDTPARSATSAMVGWLLGGLSLARGIKQSVGAVLAQSP